MTDTIYSLKWWLTVVLLSLVLNVIASFLHKYFNSILGLFFKGRSQKKLDQEEKRKWQVAYLSGNYNELVIELLGLIAVLILMLFFLVFLGITCILLQRIIDGNGEITLSNFFPLISLFALIIVAFFFQRYLSNEVIESAISYLRNKDISSFFTGLWLLDFDNGSNKDKETFEIQNNNHYIANGSLRFFIKNFEIDHHTKVVRFEKYNLDGKRHSIDTLKILDENTLEGADNNGYKLYYKRLVTSKG